MYILHALLHDRVLPSLTDDQIGPLDDDNAGEESCVAGELYDLSALVCLVESKCKKIRTFSNSILHIFAQALLLMTDLSILKKKKTRITDPLLSVAVFQVIYIFVVPQHSDPQQVHGEETVFSQDHKVCEEPSCGLYHT